MSAPQSFSLFYDFLTFQSGTYLANSVSCIRVVMAGILRSDKPNRGDSPNCHKPWLARHASIDTDWSSRRLKRQRPPVNEWGISSPISPWNKYHLVRRRNSHYKDKTIANHNRLIFKTGIIILAIIAYRKTPSLYRDGLNEGAPKYTLLSVFTS